MTTRPAEFDPFTTEALIHFANVLSARLNGMPDEFRAGLEGVFMDVCGELERRGVVLSDHVVCPE